MTQSSFILIQDCTLFQIKKAIRQWINKYDKSLSESFFIELYQYDINKYVIIPKEDINNQSFNFLINYLYYPENIKYNPKISGYTFVKDTTIFPKEKLNCEIEVFVPEYDTEYDNVYAVTQDHEVFKIDFGGKTFKSSLVKSFYKPPLDFSVLSSPQILKKKKVDPEKVAIKEKEKIKKRTSILSLIFLLLILISYALIGNLKNFSLMTGFIFVGIWAWFIFDYKMLQHLSFFLIAMAISILVIIYCYLLFQRLPHIDYRFVKPVSYMPVFLLTLQFPLRRLFLIILKREPIVDRPAPSIADFVYTIILWMTSSLLPFIIIK
jgi:hypothetical protein